eukprot:gene12793-9347_t
MDATGAGAAVEGRDGPAPVVEEEGGQQLVGEAGASVEEVDEEIEGSSVSLLPDEVKLDPEVQQAISQAFPSDDPLDNPDFDPVDYINSLFPNEQALVKLDDFALKLKKKIWRVDNDIQVSIRGQTNVGSEEQALEDAQEGMTELFTRIRDIKQKAELSEKMVQEITRDIKSLDYAKKHLTGSITTLNHLKMLVSGVDTLNTLVKQRLYRDVANMLGAVLNVMEHFDKYTEIERIKDFELIIN